MMPMKSTLIALELQLNILNLSLKDLLITGLDLSSISHMLARVLRPTVLLRLFNDSDYAFIKIF